LQDNATMHATALPRLVLGSSSPYRRELLSRLHLPFDTCSPDIDESPLPGEAPRALAARLSQAKAARVAELQRAAGHADVLVIGSDQVADLNGQCLGKPGHHAGATAQLRAMSGQTVHFHTALTVLRTGTGQAATEVHSVAVTFRELTDSTIARYLALEQPYDCAGSAKVESLGIALLSRVQSDDPTTLIGLPLMAVARLMREMGLDPLAA
jgi:septum formation protein